MKLSTILNDSYYKKDTNAVITHTRIKNAKHQVSGGSYLITDTKWDTFMKTYFNEIIKRDKKEHITEKQNEARGVLCLDFDFKYSCEVTKRQHDISNITEYLDNILKILAKLVQFSEQKFDIFVFEKRQRKHFKR